MRSCTACTPCLPLPRNPDARRTLNFEAAEAVAAHVQAGGITRYLYGGNAFLYHITLDEYEALLAWLAGFPAPRWAIPSVGPSFGRAMDQARLVRRHAFRCVMQLPCGDPRDAAGMEAGLREVADACGVPLILYLKSEDGFGGDLERGLDAVGRLVDDGVAVAISTRWFVTTRNPTLTWQGCCVASMRTASSAEWASVRPWSICVTSSWGA